MTISIITTTFNSADTLKDTFDSVLRQNYADYEIVVIDGASTDNTLQLIKDYEKLFQGKMRWISEPDFGIYDAINKGIAMAKGEIVGMLHSDDFFTNFNVLNTIANRFEKYPDVEAIYGDVHYVQRNDITKQLRYYSSRLFRRSWMRMGFMPAHPSFYCKRETYERFKLNAEKLPNFKGNPSNIYYNPSYKIAADFEMLLRMIFVGRIKTHYVWKDFVTMRHGGTSSSGWQSHKQIIKEHQRAFYENGVYFSFLLVALRYLYKTIELLYARLTNQRRR